MAKRILYLAAPYSHWDPAVRWDRHERTTRAAARLVMAGHVVHSPITMTHAIEQRMRALQSEEFWLDFDKPFMAMCEELVVLGLPGWRESKGVAIEIAAFTQASKPVHFINEGEDL